ncbi:MAG TPA: hypothetical protein VIL24_00965 [Clostridia bacterium]
MKNAKIFLVIILIFASLYLFGCGKLNPAKENAPNGTEKNIQNESDSPKDLIGELDKLLPQDNIGQNEPQESDQLSGDETPNTQEDYQKPTEPILLEPLDNPRQLYNKEKEWQIEVSKENILQALESMKIQVWSLSPIEIDTKDEQGCCSIISIGGKLVNAYELCQRLKLPSTYITEIKPSGDYVTFRGQGYFNPE